jgi:hypothetical protein
VVDDGMRWWPTMAFAPITRGDAELGLWCDAHALPHGYRVPRYILSERGVRILRALTGCEPEPQG